MTMIAYPFLHHRRLATVRRGKQKEQRTTTSAKLTCRAQSHRRSDHATASAMPSLPKIGQRAIAA